MHSWNTERCKHVRRPPCNYSRKWFAVFFTANRKDFSWLVRTKLASRTLQGIVTEKNNSTSLGPIWSWRFTNAFPRELHFPRIARHPPYTNTFIDRFENEIFSLVIRTWYLTARLRVYYRFTFDRYRHFLKYCASRTTDKFAPMTFDE